jgi:hypothetical protein
MIGPKGQDVLRPFLDRDPERYRFCPSEAMAERHARAATARVTPRGRGSAPRPRRRHPKRTPGERYMKDAYRVAIARACDKAFPHPKIAEAQGKRLTRAGRRELAAWCQEYRDELKDWRRAHAWNPHRLRHTRGTEIRRTYGLEAAQVVPGHAKADTTEIYAERDAAKARDIMAAIG